MCSSDLCGMITFMIGAMCCFGWGVDLLKACLILLTVMVISPLTSHEIARLSNTMKEEVLDEGGEDDE